MTRQLRRLPMSLLIVLCCALITPAAFADTGPAACDAPAALGAPTAAAGAALELADGSAGGDALSLAATAWGGPVATFAVNVERQQGASCGACTSNQNQCTNSLQCENYCQVLVGESGFCNTTNSCNCCVCPSIFGDPPGGGGGGGGGLCQPICRCGDGVNGPQGVCDDGCRQINCL